MISLSSRALAKQFVDGTDADRERIIAQEITSSLANHQAVDIHVKQRNGTAAQISVDPHLSTFDQRFTPGAPNMREARLSPELGLDAAALAHATRKDADVGTFVRAHMQKAAAAVANGNRHRRVGGSRSLAR